MTEVVKITVNLHKQNMDAAREIATKQSKTLTDVVNHAISMEKYFADLPKGSKIIIKRPDDSLSEVVFR